MPAPKVTPLFPASFKLHGNEPARFRGIRLQVPNARGRERTIPPEAVPPPADAARRAHRDSLGSAGPLPWSVKHFIRLNGPYRMGNRHRTIEGIQTLPKFNRKFHVNLTISSMTAISSMTCANDRDSRRHGQGRRRSGYIRSFMFPDRSLRYAG